MPKKTKLRLEGLKIQSFVTSIGDKARMVRGGAEATVPIETCEIACDTWPGDTCETCNTDCGSCWSCDTCSCPVFTVCIPKCID
jgi:hypothetical protein